MEPIGPLMIEHRLIGRMLAVIEGTARIIRRERQADTDQLRGIADFLVVYVDHCHHRKEEDILFRGLEGKKLSGEHRLIMEDLIRGHNYMRATMAALNGARRSWSAGRAGALEAIAGSLETVADFYPRHTEEEDKRFFFPALQYFNREERDAMLRRFDEYDRTLLHAEFRDLTAQLEAAVRETSAV